MSTAAAWSLVLDAYAMEAAYQSAQKLWRNGRCVVVQAPDYGSETSIEVSEQEKTQHTEEVAPGSETKFTANLRHRFGRGALSQPVEAALASGEKKLEPTHLDTVPASLTYTAPDEADKHATARLRSTSKRGIGTLVLAFDAAANLTLSPQGNLRHSVAVAGIVISGPVSIGPAEFRKRDGGGFEAVATFKSTLHVPAPAQGCEIVQTETGSLILTATVEKRGDGSVWVVRLDGNRSTTNVSLAGCGASGGGVATGAGDTLAFFLAVSGCGSPSGPCGLAIPIEGGTVPVRGSYTVAPGEAAIVYTGEGTVVATVKKK